MVEDKVKKNDTVLFEEIADISEHISEAEFVDDEGHSSPAGDVRDSADAGTGRRASSSELEDLLQLDEGVMEPNAILDDYDISATAADEPRRAADFDIEALSTQVNAFTRVAEKKKTPPVQQSVEHAMPGDVPLPDAYEPDAASHRDIHAAAKQKFDYRESFASSNDNEITLTSDELDNLDIDLVEPGESDDADSDGAEFADGRREGISTDYREDDEEIIPLNSDDIEMLEVTGKPPGGKKLRKVYDRFTDDELGTFLDEGVDDGGKSGDGLEFDFNPEKATAGAADSRRMIDDDLLTHEPVEGIVPTRTKKNKFVIELDDEIAEKLPEDFNVAEVGTIDLVEAEAIANEKVLFLTEEDIIEELEDVDLVFLGDHGPQGEDLPSKDDGAIQDDAAVTGMLSHDERRIHPDTVETAPEVETEEHETDETGAGFDSPVEEIMLDETGNEGIAVGSTKPLTAGTKGKKEKTAIPGDFSGQLESPEKHVESTRHEEAAVSAHTELIAGETTLAELDSYDGEDFDVVFDTLEPPHAGTGANDTARPRQDRDGSAHADASVTDVDLSDRDLALPDDAPSTRHRRREMERVSDDVAALVKKSERFKIIDDTLVESEEVDSAKAIFDDTELEKITADIIEVVETDARLLEEAAVADDQVRIASVMKGSAPAFEDLLIDFEDEYQFIDTELVFIDTVILDDVRKDGMIIGDDVAAGSRKQATQAVEIIGLTGDEITVIEDNVFIGEYDTIDVSGFTAMPRTGQDQPASDREMLRDFYYHLPYAASLNADERVSIEEDVEDDHAYIYEENIDDIRKKLDELARQKDGASINGFADISNGVVVIESQKDLERFIETIPEKKRDSMRKLLRYLDGLFEKLPEDVVKKFVDSEYFSLYQDVLKEMGL